MSIHEQKASLDEEFKINDIDKIDDGAEMRASMTSNISNLIDVIVDEQVPSLPSEPDIEEI